jgi:outer membrane protein
MNESFLRGCRRSRRGEWLLAGWLVAGLLAVAEGRAQTNGAAFSFSTNSPGWVSQPLSLLNAMNVALQRNGQLQKARADLEASHGVVIQTRAIIMPHVQATGNYTRTDPNAIESFPGVNSPSQTWNGNLRVVQSIYEGGRVASAWRAARLTREQAVLQYQTAVDDVLLLVRVAYFDVLVAQQQITVNEASVNLLSRELEDQQRRFNAGTIPRFNVLRAEVAVANARPPLIQARNTYRVAKNNLSNLMGYNLPRDVWEDIPLNLTDHLEAPPYQIDLPRAISQAFEKRPELGVLRRTEQLQRENIINAKSGYKPSIQAFAGYGWRNSQFTNDIGNELNGWNVGAQLNWNIFDGMLTRGRVIEARALHEKAQADVDDTMRRIELEVRTAYSTFIEAKEVLQSQEKVQEQAEEALRLANARTDAGTGTQLDVLDAETALTQARTTQVQALHDYEVALARLERATGQNLAGP